VINLTAPPAVAAPVFRRDARLDALRGAALLLVILAHIPGVPDKLFQLRTFDVPLMAFCLGASFAVSSLQRREAFGAYLYKRFIRLVVPAWVFGVLYLLLVHLTAGETFTGGKLLQCLFLLDDVGYIWVLRVFFAVALAAPLLGILARLGAGHWAGRLWVLAGLVGAQALLLLLGDRIAPPLVKSLFDQLVATPFGYLPLAMLGVFAVSHREKRDYAVYAVLTAALAALLCLWVSRYGLTFQAFKQPPRDGYLLWGLTASLGAFLVSSIPFVRGLLAKQAWIGWLSRHSITLYFVHVFFLLLTQNLNLLWWVKYPLIVFFSVLAVSPVTEALFYVKMYEALVKGLGRRVFGRR
jgi:peptidoglycan/LPS O-acetylase OafA/YrhL